ncbi:MAG: riboflavin synthase [Actinomycetia bacterium]|nr:riboflavin synthase [Actinomycetes bacterium]
MFTGIVSELGAVARIGDIPKGRTVTIDASSTLAGLAIGDSVAVNGVCLTVTERDEGSFTVAAVEETLERTTIGSLTPGDAVNLERPMAADGRFDGHIVQGHVDGVGHVCSIVAEGDASRMHIEMPQGLGHYVVEKGSITVDGTSLTVTAVGEPDESPQWFEIVLIPHTLAVTVLGQAQPGTAVNLEVDVIAKYVERMLGGPR